MYVCVYIYIHIYIPIYIYVYTYIHIYTYIYGSMYSYMYIFCFPGEKYMTDPEERVMEKAKKAYEKAARLAPGYAWPHYELGNMELEATHYDEAVSPRVEYRFTYSCGATIRI